MTGWQIGRDRGGRGLVALLIALALLPPATVQGAAPPSAEEAPGPRVRPLFDPEPVHTDPVHMALAVMGSPAAPNTGPIGAAAVLVAGGRVGTWNLEGVLTRRYSRWYLGASTLVGGGFGIGTPPLAQLATLRYGTTLDVYSLFDTDRFYRLPEAWLRPITDGARVGLGGAESVSYASVIKVAFFTSLKAFQRAARPELTYRQLIDEANTHRGAVVPVEGRLMRVNRFDPPQEAADVGVNDLFEAWVFTDRFGADPHCVVFSHWPEGLSRSLLGKPKITDIVRVKLDGYFFKTFKYKAFDRKGTERTAPLLIAHTLVYLPAEAVSEGDAKGWIRNLLYAFVGMLVALVVGVLSITFWFRRNDNSTRRRLLAQAPEFALPPPDAPPTAYPVAARPVNGLDRAAPMPARITFPASGKGDGERGEGPASKEGKPPDEGAGA